MGQQAPRPTLCRISDIFVRTFFCHYISVQCWPLPQCWFVRKFGQLLVEAIDKLIWQVWNSSKPLLYWTHFRLVRKTERSWLSPNSFFLPAQPSGHSGIPNRHLRFKSTTGRDSGCTCEQQKISQPQQVADADDYFSRHSRDGRAIFIKFRLFIFMPSCM